MGFAALNPSYDHRSECENKTPSPPPGERDGVRGRVCHRFSRNTLTRPPLRVSPSPAVRERGLRALRRFLAVERWANDCTAPRAMTVLRQFNDGCGDVSDNGQSGEDRGARAAHDG